MRRGEIWTVAGGGAYTGKPRPVVVVQSDLLANLDSVTVCPFTTDLTEAPMVRVPISPSPETGLREPSRLMADKLTTIARRNLGRYMGRLTDADVARLDQAILLALGLAGP